MKFSKDEMVQREHFFAIVDEIDSCLIDEARTPLIISGAAEDRTTQYLAIDKLIRFLKEKDYEVDEKDKNVLLTNDGINNIEKIFSKIKTPLAMSDQIDFNYKELKKYIYHPN